MNKVQANRRAMMLAVKNVFTKYPEDVASVPVLQKSTEEFVTRLEEINNVLMIQEGRITGTAEQKQKEENEMIDATIKISAGLYVYALDHSNFELAEKVDLSPSDLSHMSQAKLQTTCQSVLQLARENSDQLGEYGITVADIDAQEKEMNDYISIMSSPRSEIVTRSQATGLLKTLIKKQMDLLNMKIDKLMLKFKNSNSVFYNEYKSARIIVNLGVRHQAIHEEETITE